MGKLNLTIVVIKKTTMKYLRSHWPIIVGSLVLILCGVLTVLLEHCGADWAIRIQENVFQSHARLDSKSMNCLNIAEGCVQEGNYPKAIALINARTAEISYAEPAIAFLNNVLNKPELAPIHPAARQLQTEVFLRWSSP